MGLEERIENSESSGFFDQIWKRKWLRRSVLPLVAATSIFFGAERTLHSATSKQSETLTHDPVLLIHGLDINPSRSLEDYTDFNANNVVDFEDFFLFAEGFGTKEGETRYDGGFDVNRDGRVNIDDFFIFSENFGKIINNPINPFDGHLESTWDELSTSLVKDLGWKNGGTIGKWVPKNTEVADFYKLRLSSGDALTFDTQGEEVRDAVDKIVNITKKEKVILVGFSMGGLSARAYLQNNPTSQKASALVTICTPHVGSYLAYLQENDKPKISEWKSKFKGAVVEETAELFISALSKKKPVIKHLAPSADSLRILNNNIYKMPTNIPYINVVSQVTNLEVLEWYLELINRYALDYEKYKQAASPGLLAKGDGVVPTISQLLSYAIINTNSQNASWYEKVKSKITENAEMQVSHLKGNKQTAVLKKVLDDVIKRITPPITNHLPNKPSNPSPKNLATDIPLEVLLDWEGSDPDSDALTYKVYFEKNDSSPDQVLNSNLSESEIKVSNLENNVTYYWQVIANDGKSGTSGDLWSFKTKDKKNFIDIKNFSSSIKKGDYATYVYKGDINGTIRKDVTGTKKINGKDAFIVKSELATVYFGYDKDKWLFYGGENKNIGEFLFHPPIVLGTGGMYVKSPIVTTGYIESKEIDLGTALKFREVVEILETDKFVSYYVSGLLRKFEDCLFVKTEYTEKLSGTDYSSVVLVDSYLAPKVGDVHGNGSLTLTGDGEIATLNFEYSWVRDSYNAKPTVTSTPILPYILNVDVGKMLKNKKLSNRYF